MSRHKELAERWHAEISKKSYAEIAPLYGPALADRSEKERLAFQPAVLRSPDAYDRAWEARTWAALLEERILRNAREVTL